MNKSGIIEVHDDASYYAISLSQPEKINILERRIKKNIMFLFNEVSSEGTLHLTPSQTFFTTPTQLFWEVFSQAAITSHRMLIHIYQPLSSFYTAE